MLPHTRFQYGITEIRDLSVDRVRRNDAGKVTRMTLRLEDEIVEPTQRFWRSFFQRFRISANVFRYFEPVEVFERISRVGSDTTFRTCIEIKGGKRRLLGVTSPTRPVLPLHRMEPLLETHGAIRVQYGDGVLSTTHLLQSRRRREAIGGDQFEDRLVLESPVDGFGNPRLYLSLMRQVCTNGMVGYSPAFRTEIPAGRDLDVCIDRALASFDSSDGFVALRQRFESAQTSYASVAECVAMGKLLEKLEAGGHLTEKGLPAKFRTVAGNLLDLYGLANLDALTQKRRRVLPAPCRMYDLLNFASEVATHHADAHGARVLQAQIGTWISDEYDLEGTARGNEDFEETFMPSTVPAEA
ncbi:MAG: DUF932 domain-containing protein [Myxococcota bacterium]